MTSTTLVNTTTGNESNLVQTQTTHHTSTEKPNTVTNELRVMQTSMQTTSARQPVPNPVQDAVDRSPTDNTPFYKHLNPYARGHGKTFFNEICQKPPDPNETQTAKINHVTPMITKNMATPILNNRMQLVPNSVQHNLQLGNSNDTATRDLFNPHAKDYTRSVVTDKKDHNNNTYSNQEYNSDNDHPSLEKPATSVPINTDATSDHVYNPYQSLPTSTVQQLTKANRKNPDHKKSGKLYVSKFIEWKTVCIQIY